MPVLIIEKGKDKGQTIHLEKDYPIEAGRGQSADLQLRDSMTSRTHFCVEFLEADWHITDLGSSNGTLVNGKRIDQRTRLEFGDTILAGDVLITFAADEEAGETLGIPGTAVAGYIIERRVGRGGMGTVYKALQVSLDRPVALKVLSKELVQDKNFINLFIREARAAGQLNHPNLVQVYDVGSSDGVYYFSMEFVGGGSIEDMLNRDGRLSVHQALAYTIDAACGLEYAKKRGIVHRDIKPDNLMLTDDEVIKIGDLGIARTMQEGIVSQKEGVSGSPHYMAPEQAQGLDIDHRADIYGLGVSLFQMLTGRTPYLGSSPREIIMKQINEPAPSIRSINPDVPEDVCAVVEGMMAKDRASRYQNATELLEDLLELQRRFPPDGTVTRPDAFDWRRLALPGTIIALAIVAAIIAYVLVTGYIESNRLTGRLREDFRKELKNVNSLVQEYERSGNKKKLDWARKAAETLHEEYLRREDHAKFTDLLEETRKKYEEIDEKIKRLEARDIISKSAGEYGKIEKLIPKDLGSAGDLSLVAAKRQLEDFLGNEKYRNLPVWGKANRKLTEIKLELRNRSSFRNEAKQKIERLENEVGRHMAAGRYLEALKACEKFPEKYRRIKSISDRRDALESGVVKTVGGEISKQLTDVQKLVSKGELEKAQSRIIVIEREFADKAYGSPRLKIERKRREIENLIRKRDEDAIKIIRRGDLDRFNKAIADASAYIRQHGFNNASDQFKLARPWLRTGEFKEKIGAMTRAMNRLVTLKRRMCLALNGPLKGTNLEIGKFRGRVVDADKDFITLKGAAGMNDKVRWSKVSGDDFLKIAQWASLDAESTLALAIYLNETGKKRDAASQAGRAIRKDRSLGKPWREYLNARSAR